MEPEQSNYDPTIPTTDQRERLIAEMLQYIIDRWKLLTDWEKQWTNSVRLRPPRVFSQKMFNLLHRIHQEVKRKELVPDDVTLVGRRS